MLHRRRILFLRPAIVKRQYAYAALHLPRTERPRGAKSGVRCNGELDRTDENRIQPVMAHALAEFNPSATLLTLPTPADLMTRHQEFMRITVRPRGRWYSRAGGDDCSMVRPVFAVDALITLDYIALLIDDGE